MDDSKALCSRHIREQGHAILQHHTPLWRISAPAARPFRAAEREGHLAKPLAKPLMPLRCNLRHAFEPQDLVNPGCIHPEL